MDGLKKKEHKHKKNDCIACGRNKWREGRVGGGGREGERERGGGGGRGSQTDKRNRQTEGEERGEELLPQDPSSNFAPLTLFFFK